MKIYLRENVFDAAVDRIRRIFDEFDDVVVSFSGGKDSTATLNLALMVAEERGRLPLTVMFLDQEAEWRGVIEYVRRVMYDPRINPMWFQMPIKLTNATSSNSHYLDCWSEGGDWMRPKEPIAIGENIYGTDRFHALFPAIMKHHWKGPLAILAGVRAEESPARLAGLTGRATYKDITWGKKQNKALDQYNFYPLYDWSYTDIWAAIQKNKWDYCKVYDAFYSYGVPPLKMRISNLHHETAVHQLFYLQEIERDTWDALTKRLEGISQARHLTRSDMFATGELPFMFADWKEYRDHLLANLITDEEYRDKMAKKFAALDKKYDRLAKPSVLHKVQITTILANDVDFTKIDNFLNNPYAIAYRRWARGDTEFIKNAPAKNLKWIPENV